MRTCIALVSLLAPLAGQRSATVQPLFAGFRPDVDCEQPHLAGTGTQALVFVAGGRSVMVAIRSGKSFAPGQAWSEPLPVADLPDLAFGNHRGPRIASVLDVLLVACIETRFDAATRTSAGSGNLTVRRSTDAGAHWSEPVTVNSENGSAREGLHAIASDSAINVAVVWLDSRGEPKGNRLWCALSRDGGATFGKDFLVHGGKAPICPCCHPSLCYGSQGPVALWRDAIAGNRDMYTGLIAGQDKAIASPQAASPVRWRLDACPMDGGGLAVADAGRPVSVFRREDTVYWASGGREHRLGTGRNPAVAIGEGPLLEGKKALAVWESDDKLLALRFDPEAKAGKDKQVGKGEEEPLHLGAGAFPCIVSRGLWFTVAAEVVDRGHKRIAALDL